MGHKERTEGGYRLFTEQDLQRLRFIRYAKQLGFTLEAITELLSIRVDPEHHTCQESKQIVDLRLLEVEKDTRAYYYARFAEDVKFSVLW